MLVDGFEEPIHRKARIRSRENLMDAMDAVYEEVKARKRKQAWETTKKVVKGVFEFACYLYLLYGTYYFWFEVQLGKSVIVGTSTLFVAGLLFNLKDRKIDKLEKELKKVTS